MSEVVGMVVEAEGGTAVEANVGVDVIDCSCEGGRVAGKDTTMDKKGGIVSEEGCIAVGEADRMEHHGVGISPQPFQLWFSPHFQFNPQPICPSPPSSNASSPAHRPQHTPPSPTGRSARLKRPTTTPLPMTRHPPPNKKNPPSPSTAPNPPPPPTRPQRSPQLQRKTLKAARSSSSSQNVSRPLQRKLSVITFLQFTICSPFFSDPFYRLC